jgi:BRO family protein
VLTVNESGLYSLIFSSRKPEAKRFRKWVTSEVLPAIRQTGRYVGYSENDPDPIIVWSKLLGVRPSDVITKGFGIGYLTGGPINPSDYLAHNHRVLCYMVTGLSSSWEGLHAQTSIRVGRDANGRRDSSPSNPRSPTGSSKPTRPRRALGDALIMPSGRQGQPSATSRRPSVFCSRRPPTDSPLHREIRGRDRSPALQTRRTSSERMSDEIAKLRTSVSKLARAQNALLFNVKASSDRVQSCRARRSA